MFLLYTEKVIIAWWLKTAIVAYNNNDLLKTALITALGARSKQARNFLYCQILITEQDMTQLLAKFKTILHVGFKAT